MMWKQIRNSLWALLFLIMAALVPVNAQASEPGDAQEPEPGGNHEYEAGAGIQASLTEDGILTFAGTGEMEDWNSSSIPWKEERDSIQKVVVGEGIKKIGNHAFDGCRQLVQVKLPGSLEVLGDYAFYGCRSLEEVELREGITTLGDNVFQNCSVLAEVRIPSTMATVGSNGAFQNCENLERVVFSYGMEEVPAYICREMQGLKIVEFEGHGEMPSRVTSIGESAFHNCYALEEARLPESLTLIQKAAFYNCKGLKEVAFPGKLATIQERAFYSCEGLAGVAFPRSLEEIGESAFAYCKGLATVGLNEGLVTLGGGAFYNCDALPEVTIPSTLATVGYNGAFSGCANLERVVFAYGMEGIPENSCKEMRGLKEIVFEADGGQPSKINTIGKAAFASCEGLECISLPEGLAAIGESAFEDCLALQDVVLPMSLEEIGRAAFRYCRNLRMVSTGNKISKVGDYAFYTGSQGDILVDTQSEAIKSHDWENDRRTPTFSSASYIAGKSVRAGLFGNGLLAFAGTGEMENWTEGTLPWKDALKRVKSVQIGQGITSLGEWMAAGSAITEVMMGDNVRAIGSRAFSGCSQLTYIEIGSGVKYIGANAFWAPNMLQTVLVTENETAKQYNWAGDNRQTAEGVEVYKISGSVAAHLKDGILTIRGYGETGDYGSYNIPWKDQEITSAIVMEGIERIGNNCFRGFGGITSIQLPDSLESIGEYAFYECASLVEVDFPENMDSLGRDAFYHCTSLVSADLENVKLNAIPYNAFEGCTSLRSIQIPSSVERVESGAFKDCTQVNKLVLAEGVSYLGAEAFGGCENIKSIMIPRSLRSVGASGENGPFGAGLVSASFAARTRSIADGLFRGCSLLEDVAMPRTVSEIGGNAFRGCISLEKLQMPDSLYSIGGYAFYGCEKLKEIAWEEDLQVVGEYAFYGCASLEKAPLPSQLRNLGRYAFYGCSGLTEVSFGKELKKIESYSFYGTNLKQVNLPYKISSIESLAFAGNTGLNTITIPANTTDIAGNALDGVTGTVVGGAAGSAAESFAQDQGYAFQDGIAAKQLTYKEEEVTMAVGARKLLELEVSPFHMTDQIVWESEDGEVATITVDEGDPAIAQVHAKGAGQTKIVAKAGSLTAVCTVNVGKYVTSITIDPSYANITEIPGNVQLEASVYPRDAENGELVWKSSNENVATVSQDGLVASVGNGMARITAATSDNTVRSSCFVKVNVYVPVERVDIFEQELLLTGKERKLEASVLPANATNQEVVWSSSDETVAVVDNQGIVTPVAEGTAEVKAEAKDGGQYGVCQVTVKYVETPVTGVTLDKNEITLAEVGASEQLTAKVQPENAEIQEVEWYSENEKVAEVDENGLVTAKGGGITNIVVKTKDGGYEASCQVTAQSLIEKITLSQTELKLEKGETAVLTATLTPYNVLDSSVEWYSTNTNIVTVDKKGLVTAVADGKAAVKCRSLDGTNITAVCQVAVGKREPAPITPAPPKPSAPVTPKPEKPVDTRPVKKKVSGVKLNKKKVSIRVGSSMTLKTTVLPSDASDRRVKWSTGNGKVASVSQKGVVKAKKAGRAAITVRSVSDPRKKAICTITVNPKEKVKLTSIQAGKKNLTVKWKKLKASGCQIQCSLNKKFSPKKAVMVKGGKTGKGKVTGLKAGKKYFVRVRVYQVEGGKKYYGPWSLVKSKKTK